MIRWVYNSTNTTAFFLSIPIFVLRGTDTIRFRPFEDGGVFQQSFCYVTMEDASPETLSHDLLQQKSVFVSLLNFILYYFHFSYKNYKYIPRGGAMEEKSVHTILIGKKSST